MPRDYKTRPDKRRGGTVSPIKKAELDPMRGDTPFIKHNGKMCGVVRCASICPQDAVRIDLTFKCDKIPV